MQDDIAGRFMRPTVCPQKKWYITRRKEGNGKTGEGMVSQLLPRQKVSFLQAAIVCGGLTQRRPALGSASGGAEQPTCQHGVSPDAKIEGFYLG